MVVCYRIIGKLHTSLQFPSSAFMDKDNVSFKTEGALLYAVAVSLCMLAVIFVNTKSVTFSA
jgi:hypothetical protein